MSVRAQLESDYVQGGGVKLGKMGGKHKDEMNSMFDTRGNETENYQKNLLDALEANKKKYDMQLFSDWVVKVYQKCSIDCIQPPTKGESTLSDFEKRCATNCIRKYEKGYKLYSKVEDQIFNSYMETTGIDPQQFYAAVNNMTP